MYNPENWVFFTRLFTCNKMLHIFKNGLPFDQPVGFVPPTEAVEAPVNMWFLKYTLGNIKIGQTLLPMALQQQTL